MRRFAFPAQRDCKRLGPQGWLSRVKKLGPTIDEGCRADRLGSTEMRNATGTGKHHHAAAQRSRVCHPRPSGERHGRSSQRMGVPDRLSEGCERQQTGLLAGREVRVRKPTPTSNFPNFRALCGEPSPSMHDARGREQGAGSREQGAGGGAAAAETPCDPQPLSSDSAPCPDRRRVPCSTDDPTTGSRGWTGPGLAGWSWLYVACVSLLGRCHGGGGWLKA